MFGVMISKSKHYLAIFLVAVAWESHAEVPPAAEVIPPMFANISQDVLTSDGKRARQEMPPSQKSLLELGAERLEDYSSFISILEYYYGVDRELLIGIWGIETRYGLNVGSQPIGSALRSFSANNPSRRDFAQQQLRSATRLVNQGIIDKNDLVGSYAGALGQTQFIPTSYENYGVDGDGNGTIDLWGAKDALASTANYMNAMGWVKGQPWGLAVKVPDGFYDIGANRERHDMAFWKAAGLLPKYEPTLPTKGEARVERFAGGDYLLYDNFYAILKYNASREYAFSVSALGDQVVNPQKPGVKEIGEILNAGANIRANDAPKTKDAKAKGPCKSKICGAQIRLKKLGYYHGDIDGEYGQATRNALGRFIRDHPQQGILLLR